MLVSKLKKKVIIYFYIVNTIYIYIYNNFVNNTYELYIFIIPWVLKEKLKVLIFNFFLKNIIDKRIIY